MRPGKYFFDPPPAPRRGPTVWVEVHGHRMPQRGRVSHEKGLPAWRLMYFHDPMPLSLAESEWSLPRGTLVLIPPHVPSRYGHGDRSWRHSWFRFAGPDAEKSVRRGGMPVSRPMEYSEGSWARWAQLLFAECGSDGASETAVELLTLWLSTLRRQVSPGRPPKSAALVAVRDHLEANWRQAFRLEELARRAGLSPRHFCTRFREAFGRPPLAFHTELRLRHAREALLDTPDPVGRIAEWGGWNDVFHFSHQFKARYGCSPKAFREGKGVR